jgi:hypothetical protein
LERPSVRSIAVAEKRPTGKSPLILEYLAGLTSIADIKDIGESIEVKETKKRPREKAETSGSLNFLKQYVKKT